MAKGEIVPTASQVVGLDDTQFEWETTHVEAPNQIVFENIGDTFIGEYMGKEIIEFVDNKGEPQSFTQLKFRVHDEWFVINAGYDLLQAFSTTPEKAVTRIQLRTLVDVGQNDPMKSYRVDTAKPLSNADNSKS